MDVRRDYTEAEPTESDMHYLVDKRFKDKSLILARICPRGLSRHCFLPLGGSEGLLIHFCGALMSSILMYIL